MEGCIADVRCPNCGAPAKYDIIKHQYLCSYCGGHAEIEEAIAQKKGFRSILKSRIKREAEKYHLISEECPGCGAKIVVEEGEAVSDCAFCGAALVRKTYLVSDNLPEMIIPFRITKEEAQNCLREWCGKNVIRTEAKHLKNKIDKLQGFYLPYELIRGPVSSIVSRSDGGSRDYYCEGYVDDIFVNGSRQLDNLLLDGMEPFEKDELKEFDFGYVAGQRVKVTDIDPKALEGRVDEEVSSSYRPVVQKTLETAAVDVSTSTESIMRMPVLLPVYYVKDGMSMAAVNGQTGKVSVRAEKESHYYFLPWWVKAVLATLIISMVVFAGFRLFGMPMETAVLITMLLAFFTLIVTLCAYSDTVKVDFRESAGHRILTTDNRPLRRVDGTLVKDPQPIKREAVPPVFYEKIEGKEQPVVLKFTSAPRLAEMVILAAVVLFLPVIIALFLNGFDFKKLNLSGSAVWFCIMVPVIPIYLLKFGRIELYERPWIYRILEDGSKKRYRKKPDPDAVKETAKIVLHGLFVPPVCFGVWFGILCFGIICWLTAFGY